jgi:hypothetical protein
VDERVCGKCRTDDSKRSPIVGGCKSPCIAVGENAGTGRNNLPSMETDGLIVGDIFGLNEICRFPDLLSQF